MTHLSIRPKASVEAEAAAGWYETQQPGLGVEFILELDAALQRAVDFPASYAIQHREARRVLLQRFPYAVYFVYESEVVEVFAVLHQQQNPASWRRRVP